MVNVLPVVISFFQSVEKEKRGRVLYKKCSHPGQFVAWEAKRMFRHFKAVQPLHVHKNRNRDNTAPRGGLAVEHENDGFGFGTHSTVSRFVSLTVQLELVFHLSKQKPFSKFSVLLKMLPAHSVAT